MEGQKYTNNFVVNRKEKMIDSPYPGWSIIRTQESDFQRRIALEITQSPGSNYHDVTIMDEYTCCIWDANGKIVKKLTLST